MHNLSRGPGRCHHSPWLPWVIRRDKGWMETRPLALSWRTGFPGFSLSGRRRDMLSGVAPGS